ncbi:MAG: glycosyltransferase family 39 protein [Flavobacteriia bacterium]|nr:glycosyltransferase family 39 protein [Flavobacteriia bacterium]
MRNNLKKYLVLLVIIFLGILFQHKYINEFPSHIHAWAQSDRYALSLGFLDNDFNFFTPQTFVYNHQFPNNWSVPEEKTVTAVDFPIHDFICSILMKIYGNTSPWVFRSYILIYSFLGLFFLFKLAHNITNDYFKSLFVVVFASTSPVFVYYQSGFLPTIPSLSNAIIGIYFYNKYLKENKNKYFHLSLLLITLATLARTTFAIVLVAVLFIEFIRILKKEIKIISKWIPVGLSIILIFSYYLYNAYLREKYGSIFLNHLMPAENLKEAKEIFLKVYNNWFFDYFTVFHYFILITLIFSFIYFVLIRKIKVQKTTNYFGFLALTYFITCLIFTIAMLKQFSAHDYYFLDTFYLPIVLFLIFFLSLIPVSKKLTYKLIAFLILCIVSFGLILQVPKNQEKRRETGSWDRTKAIINNYSNSDKFIESLGIPKSSKFLVIDAVAPNMPFILMKRKGFALMYVNEKEQIENALKWKYDYIVLQNEFFLSEIYSKHPEILSKLNKIADNGKISICTYTNYKKQDLIDFLDLKKKKPILSKSLNFENSLSDTSWKNYTITDEYSFNGKFSGHHKSNVVYGLTYQTKKIKNLKKKEHTLLISSYLLKKAALKIDLVVSVYIDGKNVCYKANNLENLIKEEGKWEKVSLLYHLPQINSENYEFSFFLWNTGNSDLYYDDFEFSIY